jgi:hypothetical protein
VSCPLSLGEYEDAVVIILRLQSGRIPIFLRLLDFEIRVDMGRHASGMVSESNCNRSGELF